MDPRKNPLTLAYVIVIIKRLANLNRLQPIDAATV